MSRTRWTFVALLAVLAALSSAPVADAQRGDPAGDGRPPVMTPGDGGQLALPPDQLAELPKERRGALLGEGWQTSADRAWTTVGDEVGLHVLAAEARDGYAWRTVATLSEPGLEADRWIGNACVTGSGDRLVVVYAPRTFTNDGLLMDRGGFTAVVDLTTGAVTKLPVRTSLAYFNPGCGLGETAVLTQGGSEDRGRTRLLTVDATSGALGSPTEVEGQLTSAVPVGDGVVAADSGLVVQVAPDGSRTALARASNVPFLLRPDAEGGIVFLDRRGDQGRVRRAALEHRPQGRLAPVRTLAVGALHGIGLSAAAGGRVFVTGEHRLIAPLPAGMEEVEAPKDAEVSTTGALVLTAVQPGLSSSAEGGAPTRLAASVRATGAEVGFSVQPAGSPAGEASPAPAVDDPDLPGASATATGTVDEGYTCAVPRNDPRTQVYQPKPRQVEWAVDQAVTDTLDVSRPAGWKGNGLPAYTPQGLFPGRALAGGGRVPAQIMLGILAQESNLWQASGHALPGVTGNPLVGNYYGRELYDESSGNDWHIVWAEADCGYGVAQVTDGMRRSGAGARPALHQRAIALDFAANVAAGLQILQEKWNQTRSAGLVINDGGPESIENWFYAVWAYNSGFYPDAGDGSPWGVGWLNNPVNPNYPANRAPFLEYDYADAAHPQDWPYPEKVIGFAAHPIQSLEAPGVFVPGFRAAWWTSVSNRENAKPPVAQFCDASNACEPGASHVPTAPEVVGEPAGPCGHRNGAGQYDLRCWYHAPSTWKPDCVEAATCGHELLRFDPGYAYQADATSYAPNCSLGGLPQGALVIDDVADSVPSVRPNCGRPWTNQGSFELEFAGDGDGTFPSRVDFHQIGGGFGGHFWFAHTRSQPPNANRLRVEGTWTLNRAVNGWARVLVHMPDHGAHTQQARYEIDLGNGETVTRTLLQRTMAHRWVSLGAFPFAGQPRVRLATTTRDGDGSEDVAWDAIAVQPLPGKPRNMVVALGDSYSSGEGASPTDGSAYYRETNNNGDTAYRNACHRSPHAWSRKGRLTDSSQNLGQRADSWDTSVDYHFLACSGAQTENILPIGISNAFGEGSRQQYRDLVQLDRGFLDEHTTLVTISIGGNDALFGPIIQECVVFAGTRECYDAHLPGDDLTLAQRTQRDVPGPVKASVKQTLEWIHRLAPNASIVLMGYPQLLEPECFPDCVPQLSGGEIEWLNQMSVFLNGHLGDAVAELRADEQIDVVFADPVADFLGRGIGAGPDLEAIYGLVGTKTAGEPSGPLPPLSQQSFHPDMDGTSLYADALNRALRELGL